MACVDKRNKLVSKAVIKQLSWQKKENPQPKMVETKTIVWREKARCEFKKKPLATAQKT